MLCEITIENVAVIEKARANFDNGFTVLTGETGAGKSILIDSINAILGNRTSRDIVRSGAAKASVWANFQDVSQRIVEKLEDAGYPCQGELLLLREIAADGKSTCRINGMPTTAAMLRDICSGLVAIHGQHDNQSLMNPAKHIEVLDAFGKNSDILQNYQTAFQHLAKLDKDISAISISEAEKARKIDVLRHEVAEIDAATLNDGEEETLLSQRETVRNAQAIMQGLASAYSALSGDEEAKGAAVLLADAARNVENAANYVAELAECAAALKEMYYNASEMAQDIGRRVGDFEFGEESLENIESRLDLLYRLKKKYGPSFCDVINYGKAAKAELENIEFAEERLKVLMEKQAKAKKDAQMLADELTSSRKKAFVDINKEIADALTFLNMPGIKMSLKSSFFGLLPNGQDEMEFYISTNPGETPKPLAKIASGGELARIMLAIKSALAHRDDVPTVIYDEIDAGISGLAAGRVGQLLRGTSAGGRQVICVTHTAQIAAFAQRHLLIEKNVQDLRTFTKIKELDDKECIAELARIISGDKVTQTALANAEEMRQMANEKPYKKEK